MWTITYDIVATNAGGADGVYTLSDRLRFGDGIEVLSAEVVTVPEGVTAAATWTGEGADGDPANIVAADATLPANGVHTYQVRVVATAGGAAPSASVFDCPAPGSEAAGGFTNTAAISHNDLTDDAVACAEPDRPAVPGAIAVTGIDAGLIAGGAALLLLLGAGVLIATRRRARTGGSSAK
jgi:hypothetical protein